MIFEDYDDIAPEHLAAIARIKEAMRMATERDFVRNFINDHCIARVEPGSKALPAYGGKGYYTWQFYLREALFNPRVLDIVVRDFLSKYDLRNASREDPTAVAQLCGVESASTPLLTAIRIAAVNLGYDVNIFSIRKEQKPYGKRNWIEGKVIEYKPAMLVDDLTSMSHKTAIHAAAILKQEGIRMAPHMYAMVYKTERPRLNKIVLSDQIVTVGHMFSLNDFDLELKAYQERKK